MDDHKMQEAFILDIKSSLATAESMYFSHPTKDQYSKMVKLQGILNSELAIMSSEEPDVMRKYNTTQALVSKPYEALWS